MRIVILGAGGARKTEASIARAARWLGHDCRLVNVVGLSRYLGSCSPRIIKFLTDEFEPDFLILTRGAARLSEPTLNDLLHGRESVFWYFDPLPNQEVLTLGRRVERMCITYLGQVEAYQAAGVAQVTFLPQGVDPWRDIPAASAPASYHCDTSFVGSGQYPYRHPLLRTIASISRLQIRGPGWEGAPSDLPVVGGPVYGKRFARVVCGAAISLGASAVPEQHNDRASGSNRMWKIFGCGGFYLGPYVEGIEHFAGHGLHCLWYRDIDEAVGLVRHYLDRPDERRKIAETGRRHALEHHTYAHRVQLLLERRGYPLGSDDLVVPKLEDPDSGKPLDGC
jgi:glycosyl transferase family 1/uncharacterized protein DUF3880